VGRNIERVAGRETEGSQPLPLASRYIRHTAATMRLDISNSGTLASRAWRLASGVWRLSRPSAKLIFRDYAADTLQGLQLFLDAVKHGLGTTNSRRPRACPTTLR